MLAIHLLGTPRFARQGVPVHIGRRKTVALAAYLASARRPVGRETLAALFWPEHDQAAALKGLRRELSRLKKALGAGNVRATRSHLVLEEGSRLTVDLAAFRRHLHLVQQHDHFPDKACRLCLDALKAAVDLYAGDFMAGFNLPACPGFDGWQNYQRESVHQQFGLALKQLAAWHIAQHETEHALLHARRRLALDPLHEGARRDLMRIYAAAGQPAAALQVYDEGAALLQAELGVSPDPATDRLRTSILEGRHAGTTAPAPAPQPRPNNLPCQATPFVGRERELTMTQLRLQEDACRLLTLVGPTGIGKTRLALEAGRRLAQSGAPLFADGIVFVPLAEVEGHAEMVSALLREADFAGEGSSPGEERLLAALRSQQMLFILDNLEHLPAASTLITTILAAVPGVKILATSCTALRLREEWSHPLHGLSLPPVGDREELAVAVSYDAVRLFAERARQVSSTFSLQDQLGDVIRICRLVEGIPLALELAAGWIDVLDACTIADELEQGLDLLEARFCNVPPRQRSMRAGLRRTWSLLDGVEQEALARLALFAGSFTREEAQQVGGASLPVLSGLLEKSLVQPAGPQRFRMPQPLRHFACGQAEPVG